MARLCGCVVYRSYIQFTHCVNTLLIISLFILHSWTTKSFSKRNHLEMWGVHVLRWIGLGRPMPSRDQWQITMHRRTFVTESLRHMCWHLSWHSLGWKQWEVIFYTRQNICVVCLKINVAYENKHGTKRKLKVQNCRKIYSEIKMLYESL